MADRIAPDVRSRNMARIRSKDTGPEMHVRKLAHRLGYRFRLHRSGLPGRPDMIFVQRKKVIFIHGCFWHQHAKSKCAVTHKPKSNNPYWDKKLTGNVARDARNARALRRLGWKTLVIWECETRRDVESLERRLHRFLGS